MNEKYRKKVASLHFALLFLFDFSIVSGRRHIVDQFKDPHGIQEEEGPQFNNLVVDKNTGRVYIGAVNSLYQLSPNLELMVGILSLSRCLLLMKL